MIGVTMHGESRIQGGCHCLNVKIQWHSSEIYHDIYIYNYHFHTNPTMQVGCISPLISIDLHWFGMYTYYNLIESYIYIYIYIYICIQVSYLHPFHSWFQKSLVIWGISNSQISSGAVRDAQGLRPELRRAGRAAGSLGSLQVRAEQGLGGWRAAAGGYPLVICYIAIRHGP